MPVGGQVELVGALNWLIRSAGLVSWEDLFDEGGDSRDFDDVVRRKGLTVEQLRRAGRRRGRGPAGGRNCSRCVRSPYSISNDSGTARISDAPRLQPDDSPTCPRKRFS